MVEPRSLSLKEIRTVFRIVSECRELCCDWRRWREHLLASAVELLGARVGLSGEVPVVSCQEFILPSMMQIGWTCENEARQCHECFAHILATEPPFLRAAEQFGPVATFTRRQLVSDEDWYALPEVQTVFRQANIDGLIHSRRLCDRLSGWGDGLVVFYSRRRYPTERDRELMNLLHDEIAPLVGGPLATLAEPVPSDLSPRKRQVLDYLLYGATDKQIAASLHLSRPTVNEYVTEILHHFGVASRTELLAGFLQRYRRVKSE